MKTIAATITGKPRVVEKSSISFLATNAQKIDTGATIMNMVRNNDLPSGPNINLP